MPWTCHVNLHCHDMRCILCYKFISPPDGNGLLPGFTINAPSPHSPVLHTVPCVLWSVILGVVEHQGENSPLYFRKSGNVSSTEEVKIELTLKGRGSELRPKVRWKIPERHHEFSGYANHEKTTWYLLYYALSFRKGLAHQVYAASCQDFGNPVCSSSLGKLQHLNFAQHCAGSWATQRN